MWCCAGWRGPRKGSGCQQVWALDHWLWQAPYAGQDFQLLPSSCTQWAGHHWHEIWARSIWARSISEAEVLELKAWLLKSKKACSEVPGIHRPRGARHTLILGAEGWVPSTQVGVVFIYLFIDIPWDMWDLSSATKDQNHAPCIASAES